MVAYCLLRTLRKILFLPVVTPSSDFPRSCTASKHRQNIRRTKRKRISGLIEDRIKINLNIISRCRKQSRPSIPDSFSIPDRKSNEYHVARYKDGIHLPWSLLTHPRTCPLNEEKTEVCIDFTSRFRILNTLHTNECHMPWATLRRNTRMRHAKCTARLRDRA